MEKSYNEILELESLDNLVHGNTKLLVTTLLMFIEFLKSDKKILKKYHLEVLEYGFQGYYPVIGIQYLDANCASIEEYLVSKFEEFSKSVFLEELLRFAVSQRPVIENFVSEIEARNNDFFESIKEP